MPIATVNPDGSLARGGGGVRPRYAVGGAAGLPQPPMVKGAPGDRLRPPGSAMSFLTQAAADAALSPRTLVFASISAALAVYYAPAAGAKQRVIEAFIGVYLASAATGVVMDAFELF